MNIKTESKLKELPPGEVSPEHLTALLELTDIRSEALKAALYDHLVNGIPSTESWNKHGVNKSQGSRRLAALREKSKQVRAASIFYL